VLIRIDVKAGHGAGSDYPKNVDIQALYNMGFKITKS
jgi:hypothetical protein